MATRALAGADPEPGDGGPLVVRALVAEPLVAVVVLVALALVAGRSPARFVAPWSAIERGAALQLLALPLLVLLTWQEALRPYDFLAERTNPFDRALLVALAVGAARRPVLLVPFVLQHRILTAPLAVPFGSVQGQNVDELLVIVLAALAGAHLVVVATRSDDTAPVVSVIVAAVAAHFFLPGRLKATSGWVLEEELAYLPINANTAGWLGHTDGSPLDTLASFFAAIGPLARVATIGLELGAIVAVVHRRLTRWWLLAAIAFHVVNFVLIGYWFLGWVLVEAGLAALLWSGANRDWLARNLTPGRGAITALAVLAGPILFHPPGLAWFDTPVADGYRIEAVGVSGAGYHVPFSALAPFEQDLAFHRLTLGTESGVSGPYGVVASAAEVDALRALTDRAGVDASRRPLTEVELAARDRSEEFLAAWLVVADRRARGDGPTIDRLRALAAPPLFWTSRAEPTYRFQEPLARLEVRRFTSLTVDGEPRRWSEPVLVMEVDSGGTVSVVDR